VTEQTRLDVFGLELAGEERIGSQEDLPVSKAVPLRPRFMFLT
jgi:hypothetical protein